MTAMAEDLSRPAREFFEVRLASRREGEPRILLWCKLLFSLAAFVVTFGFVDELPRSYVQAIHRRTGTVVLEHSWRNVRYAEEDVVAMQRSLESFSLGEFCEHYSIDTSRECP